MICFVYSDNRIVACCSHKATLDSKSKSLWFETKQIGVLKSKIDLFLINK